MTTLPVMTTISTDVHDASALKTSGAETLARYAEALAERAQATIIIEGMSGGVIAHALGNHAVPTVLKDAILRRDPHALWESLSNRRLMPQACRRTVGGDIAGISAVVLDPGSAGPVGAVWVLGSDQPDAAVIEAIASTVEAFRARDLSSPDREVRDQVIARLLEGHNVAALDVISTTRPQIVVAISRPGHTSRTQWRELANALSIRLGDAEGRVHWPAEQRVGYALVPAAKIARLSSIAETVSVEAGTSLALGSSAAITSGLHFAEARQAAELALHVASRSEQTSHASITDPAVFAQAVLSTATTALRETGADNLPPVIALMEHDALRGSDLINTMRLWLDRSCDGVGVAHELGIHPNTMRYRIRRAGEIAGIDLESTEQKTALHLCLLGLQGQR